MFKKEVLIREKVNKIPIKMYHGDMLKMVEIVRIFQNETSLVPALNAAKIAFVDGKTYLSYKTNTALLEFIFDGIEEDILVSYEKYKSKPKYDKKLKKIKKETIEEHKGYLKWYNLPEIGGLYSLFVKENS